MHGKKKRRESHQFSLVCFTHFNVLEVIFDGSFENFSKFPKIFLQGFFNHHQLKSDVNYKIFIAFSKSVAPNERSCGVSISIKYIFGWI